MTGFLISYALLWGLMLFLGFLLLGALRTLALQGWRLEQLEATTPRRLGRDGLERGRKAPDFSLTCVQGPNTSLHNFAGRKVLLVFTQTGCAPCQHIIPELNRLAGGDLQVLVVNNGDAEAARASAATWQAKFPVLIQEKFSVSKRYHVFATPFAFLIDEGGVIKSKGIVNNARHIGYVLDGACAPAKSVHPETEAEDGDAGHAISSPNVKETSDV